ncbi:MAG: hypothetical protein K0U98_24185 [Deltaproteobacteria bacterium]|nr:hypothetical protein [Deltaproteobacteria bacterium]
MPNQESPPTGPMATWAKPLAWVVIVAMALGAGLYVFRSLWRMPVDAVNSGRAALKDMMNVASAFSSGTVTTSFHSYATELSGGSFFQFAQLRQTEVFERSDEATTLWGNLQLPEVMVRATAPVEYTYVLDFNGPWEFHQEGSRVVVVPPRIEVNKPAVDASRIEYEVRAGSLFRDEQQAIARLKDGITMLSFQRAKENIPLVREVGRRRVEEFVSVWLGSRFVDGEDVSVEVVFPDELEGEAEGLHLRERAGRDRSTGDEVRIRSAVP